MNNCPVHVVNSYLVFLLSHNAILNNYIGLKQLKHSYRDGGKQLTTRYTNLTKMSLTNILFLNHNDNIVRSVFEPGLRSHVL